MTANFWQRLPEFFRNFSYFEDHVRFSQQTTRFHFCHDNKYAEISKKSDLNTLIANRILKLYTFKLIKDI